MRISRQLRRFIWIDTVALVSIGLEQTLISQRMSSSPIYFAVLPIVLAALGVLLALSRFYVAQVRAKAEPWLLVMLFGVFVGHLSLMLGLTNAMPALPQASFPGMSGYQEWFALAASIAASATITYQLGVNKKLVN
ncbi:MAG: hypothetical protein RIS82_756 [Actinomycetota bacterium]